MADSIAIVVVASGMAVFVTSSMDGSLANSGIVSNMSLIR